MEERFRDAAATGLRTILLRAGDFIDPDAPGGLFDRFVIGKAAKGVIATLGDPDAAHAWAYLPDMARAAVELAARHVPLPRSRTYPSRDSRSPPASLRRPSPGTGRPMRIARFPWWMMTLASPSWELARELGECAISTTTRTGSTVENSPASSRTWT